uniref:Uncharacterized protein n=1 Tax=Anguilla anguilla TaxID=7936 RepID=A0A0E9WD29_ANGAN
MRRSPCLVRASLRGRKKEHFSHIKW